MDFHHDRESRRQQIEREIDRDPARPNREIARLLGVDHKTIGSIRGKMIKAKREAANSPIGEMGNSPGGELAGGEIAGDGEIPQGGEIGRDDESKGFDWGNLPEDVYIIRPQGMTAVYVEESSGDLIIAQDRTHDWSHDAIVRIGYMEVEAFVERLIAMVRK
jgi:hypothetical protein